MQNQTEQIRIATGNATAIANNIIVSPAARQIVRAFKMILSNNHNALNVISLHWEGYAASVTLALPPNTLNAIVYFELPVGFHYDGPAGLDLLIDVTAVTVDWVLMYNLIDA
jgi:hypothetical protein